MYYCRTLEEVKCKSCGYTTFDAYVEDYKFKEMSPNSWRSNIHMICPKCKSVDKFEFLSEATVKLREVCSCPNPDYLYLEQLLYPICSKCNKRIEHANERN